MGRTTSPAVLIAVEAVRNGKTFAEAARDSGHWYETVSRACERYGVSMTERAAARSKRASRNRPAKNHARDAIGRVLELRKEGKTYSQIGMELGLTRCAIAGIVHRHSAESQS